MCVLEHERNAVFPMRLMEPRHRVVLSPARLPLDLTIVIQQAGSLPASGEPLEPFGSAFRGPATRLMRMDAHRRVVPPFEELLAELLEEPEGVLGVLSDVVNRGRLQADYLEPEALDILSQYDLILYLIQRSPGRPLRTWVYPSATGLKVFAFLEREAEREMERERAKPRNRGRRRSA